MTHLHENAITRNFESPYVKLRNINVGDSRWTEGFWAQKSRRCEKVMVPHMGTLLKGDVGHGYNNFKFAAGLATGEHNGFSWHDGDFYKWIEASCYIYGLNKDEAIVAELDEIIAVIGQAQLPDGHLHTELQIKGIAHFSNRKYHEMYNYGHLFTAGCIHHRLTGRTNFLEIARKSADLLYELFQPQPKELGRFGFNQTQIMGLVELYRTTQDRRYLEIAEIFINNRGKYDVVEDSSTEGYPIGDMVQERVPLREETEAVGHAVLALYYYAGAADVYAETGEKALLGALDRLWDNVVNRKMYVTGAVGQTHYGASSRRDKIEEGFIDEYMMPNLTAYNETCANICNSMFSSRMLGIKGESKYADIMELVMFNSGLSGISIDGKHYYYANPLRKIHGSRDYTQMNTESPDRLPYLECFCCPPNLVRTIAQLPGWAYGLSDNGLSVNLYGGSELKTHLLDGSAIDLSQATDYPWDGAVRLTLKSCKADSFEIRLRIPDWAKGSSLKVNDVAVDVDVRAGHFARIERTWSANDVIQLVMPMEITLVEGHPRIEEVRNQVAIKRGPVVYCIETPDLPEGTDITDVYLPGDTDLTVEHRPDFLDGVSVITGEVLLRTDRESGMYRTVGRPTMKPYQATFVPYFSWSNRGPAEMSVFMPVIWKDS